MCGAPLLKLSLNLLLLTPSERIIDGNGATSEENERPVSGHLPADTRLGNMGALLVKAERSVLERNTSG